MSGPQAKKAIYYDQTVRMLREMITNEREWAESTAKAITDLLSGDVTAQYAFNTARDLQYRTIRLGVLHDILSAMTRSFDNEKDEETLP